MNITWPMEPTADEALAYFTQVSTAINMTNLMEPDANYHPPRHDLGWFAAQVRCNCSWVDSCCQAHKCCEPSPAPSPPSPPAPAPPAGGITVSPNAPPSIIHAQKYAVTPTGDARFAKTLYRFPGGQLYTNFHTACDVCVAHPSFPGRSFFSVDNGRNWTEIMPAFTNGGQAWSNCIPSGDGTNALTCFAIPVSIVDPNNNRTSGIMTTRYEVHVCARVCMYICACLYVCVWCT